MGLVFRPDTMVLFVAMGWGSAAQTFVGFHVGAGDFARAKRAAGLLAAWDVVTNIALAYAFVRYGGTLLGVFCKEPAPIALGMRYLVTVAPAYLPLGLAIVLANGLAGAGATRLTFALDLLVLLLAELPLCLLLGATPDGLFRGLALANGMLGAVYLLVFLRGRWLPSHGATPEVA
jgi:MATE family multidrug resistance protein